MSFDRQAPAQQIFADTETIPTQRLDIVEELTEEFHERRDAELAAVAPPGNMKKADTIEAWMVNERPGKLADIRAKYEAELAEALHKTCLEGAFGQLAVISLALGEEDPLTLWDTNWSAHGYEAWLLHELHRAMVERCRHHRGQQLVGHNIAFDRNMIRQRGIILGVSVHSLFAAPVKPWENHLVFDTMTEWTGDVRVRITQDKLCKALGIAGKGSDLDDGEYIDGSQVWDFIQRGEIAKVAKYCGGDVKRARAIFKVLRGLSPRPEQPVFTPGLHDLAGVLPTVSVDLAAAGEDKTSVAVIDGNGVTFVESEFPPATDEAPALAIDDSDDPF